MKCPVCGNVDLVMSERQGVEIDYCPHCRGIWLDRGELDKIIERASPAGPPAGPGPSGGFERPRGHEQGYKNGHGHKKKRGGFLEDLFDF